MIDNAIANGEIYLSIPPGTYNVSQTIECAINLSLDFSGCVLKATENVNIIKAAPGANITNLIIDWSGVTFTGCGILLDGDDMFNMNFPTTLQNIKIWGNWQSNGETGTGILINADTGFIQGVNLSNIAISYALNGIQMSHSGSAWVNGINACNINLTICRNAVLVDGEGVAFSNVQVQPDANCIRALYCSGDSNTFSNFVVWDWITPPAIEFTEDSAYNKLFTNLSAEQVLDDGWNNRKDLTEL